jgi:hypothetical protein
MNRVRYRPRAARRASEAERAARGGPAGAIADWQVAEVFAYPFFPVRVFKQPLRSQLPFVGDHAGRDSFFGLRVFSPPENGSVLLGHKPKPRGATQTIHHLP